MDYFIIFKSVRCFDYDIYVCLSIVYCLWMCYENDLCYNIVVVII